MQVKYLRGCTQGKRHEVLSIFCPGISEGKAIVLFFGCQPDIENCVISSIFWEHLPYALARKYIFLGGGSVLNTTINIFHKHHLFSFIAFARLVSSSFRCKCGLLETAAHRAVLSEDEVLRTSFSCVVNKILHLCRPDTQVRMLACTKEVDLEWTRLNFLRFTKVQNLAFVFPWHNSWWCIENEIPNLSFLDAGHGGTCL